MKENDGELVFIIPELVSFRARGAEQKVLRGALCGAEHRAEH
jgi:hypothetical protein